ncbi:MAG: hypothetical protein QOJ86_2280 [Bradyrhizobium sp.]|jgi:hypothetical protein|nr:hypothetical protein [Bradyrhizobium sp.]
MSKDAELKTRLDDEIGTFLKSCKFFRRLWSALSNGATWGIPILSTIAAFAARESYTNLATTLSAVVAVLGLLVSDFQRRWLGYRDSYTAVRLLSISSLTAEPADVEKRFAAILNEHNKMFRGGRKS